ncbi:MAG: hypothetical protein FWG91_03730 [Lachnospiraceae bacterium]|nr:hypothetical protein [Lachnospiraceae bacterium]
MAKTAGKRDKPQGNKSGCFIDTDALFAKNPAGCGEAKTNAITGFMCGRAKCRGIIVFNVASIPSAKKLAIGGGWTFKGKNCYCPGCTATNERRNKLRNEPASRPEDGGKPIRSIFKI